MSDIDPHDEFYFEPSDSEEEYYLEDEDDAEPVEPPQLTRIRALADPTLQKYLFTPPGKGMSVIYVAVNAKDGKANVGKHRHGISGRSVNTSRRRRHEDPKPNESTYFNRAMRKHGKHCFHWFILWHGQTELEDEAEKHWISPRGIHTIKDDGGWGYNLKEGGDDGSYSASSIQAQKERMNRPEVKEKARARQTARWTNADEATRLEWVDAMTKAHNRPEVLAKHSAGAKKAWENTDEETRSQRKKSLKEAWQRPDVASKHSASNKKAWENADEDKREQWKASRQKSFAKKHDIMLSNLNEEERVKKLKSIEKNKRTAQRRAKKVASMRRLGGKYERATKKMFEQAVRDGFLFHERPDGEFDCIVPE